MELIDIIGILKRKVNTLSIEKKTQFAKSSRDYTSYLLGQEVALNNALMLLEDLNETYNQERQHDNKNQD